MENLGNLKIHRWYNEYEPNYLPNYLSIFELEEGYKAYSG